MFMIENIWENMEKKHKRRMKIWNFPPLYSAVSPFSFPSRTLPSFSSEYINIWKCWLAQKILMD